MTNIFQSLAEGQFFNVIVVREVRVSVLAAFKFTDVRAKKSRRQGISTWADNEQVSIDGRF